MAALVDQPLRGINPFLRVQSGEELALAEATPTVDPDKPNPEQTTSALAAHIRMCFNEAERHRLSTGVTERLTDCQRRRQGEYDPVRLAKIRAIMGNETFFNVTATKCGTAESWLLDTMAPAGDKPWALEPTPIPDLPDNLKQQVIQGAMAYFSQSPQEPITPDAVQQVTMQLYDMTLKLLVEQAKERVGRMEKKIEDQLVECDFMGTLHKFIYYFCTYPAAFLKGPIVRKQPTLTWDNENLVIEDKIVLTYEAPNPQDIYPSPNARTTDDGYICEKVTYTAKQLMAMRGVPGWNDKAIEAVLQELATSGPVVTETVVANESERATLENRELTINNGIAAGNCQAIEFHGPTPVKLLREWGMTAGLEGHGDNDFVEATGVLISNWVVRAVLNPDPLGRRLYSWTCAEKIPDTIWGTAIPELMKDCQDPLNAAVRSMLDNLGLASGPFIAADLDALAEGQDPTNIHPWKVFMYHGSKIPNGTRKPVDWFQVDSRANELLQVAEYFENKADERTKIPRYVQGESNVGGAGDTASGLSMLMGAAAKGIKRMIGFLDMDIIRTALDRHWTWNILNETDSALKADAQVKPRGVLALLVKEQTQLRRQEFLDRTNNPVDMQIIGIKGRAAVLRAVANGLDLPVDDIVLPDEVLMAQQQAAMAQQQAMDQEQQMEAEAVKT